MKSSPPTSQLPPLLLVTPTLRSTGGTEKLFHEDLRELQGFFSPVFLTPRNPGETRELERIYGKEACRFLYLPPYLPSLPFSWEAWALGATLMMKVFASSYPIRYSPGMNGLGVTHASLHALFHWCLEVFLSYPIRSSLSLLLRDLRYRRLKQWESWFYCQPGLRVLCYSQVARTMLHTYFPELPVLVLPPPRELFQPEEIPEQEKERLRKHLSLPPSAPLILLVGNEFRVKGIDLFFQLLTRLRSRGIWGLLVSRESPWFISRITGIPVPENLRWLKGWDFFPAVYRIARVLILPSRGETLGLPPLEAYAYGVQVRVSSHCGASEFLPKRCVVPSLEIQDWEEACLHALEERGGSWEELLLPLRQERAQQFREWLRSSQG